jgi:hypothetical protein
VSLAVIIETNIINRVRHIDILIFCFIPPSLFKYVIGY